MATDVTTSTVVSYTAFPPLPVSSRLAVHFCCTVLGVASTRRYLASCPVKPGLSSPVPFRLHGSDHPSCSLDTQYSTGYSAPQVAQKDSNQGDGANSATPFSIVAEVP